MNDHIPESQLRDALERKAAQDFAEALERLRARPLADLELAIQGEKLRNTPPAVLLQCCADMALTCILTPLMHLPAERRGDIAVNMINGVYHYCREALATIAAQERDAAELQSEIDARAGAGRRH